jgi:hypothetical protein
MAMLGVDGSCRSPPYHQHRFSSDSAIDFSQLSTTDSTGVDANKPSWPLSPSP